MQLRELLNSKQVLNPLIEIKNVTPNSSLDAFNQILTKKNESVSRLDNNYSSISEKTPKITNEIDSKDVKFSAKSTIVDAKSTTKSTDEIGVTKQEPENNDLTKNEKVKSKAPDKTEKPDKEVKKDEKSDLFEKLKQKLKKETGMNDQQLEQLLATMNLDLSSLQNLLEGGEELGEMIKAIGDVLDSLEIDEALGQDLSSKDVTQIVKQLNQVIEALDKMSKELPSDDKSESKSFEQQLIQKLSKVISSLESVDKQIVLKPQEVSQSILTAITTDTSAAKTNEPIEQNTNQVSDVAINSAVLETSSKNSTENAMTDSQSDNEQSQNKTTQMSTSQETVSQQSNITKATQNVVAESSVAVENEVKVVEDSNGLSVHQVTMKNGNSVTTQTTTVTPVMKQEIVTQIMDAIKGQIKLTDQGTSMIVKLQPEQLGNVELKLNIQKGVVLAELKVENEIVKAAIESSLDDLKQSLSNKGYAIDQINVSVNSGKKENQEAFDFQERGRSKKKNDNRVEGSLDIEPLEQISRYELNELEGSTFSYYG